MAAKPIFVQAVDTNGTPYSGAKLNVYDAGTTTPRAIYTESGLGTASANPAIADANGVVVVWVNDAGGDIKVTLTNSAETVTPHNEDNVPIASLTCYPVITFQGDQSLLTTSSPTFAGLTLGNVSFAGVVTDPNADRLIFWDDSEGQVNFMTLGTGLAFNGTAIELDGDLQDISGLTPTDGGVIIGDGTDFVVESGATLRTSIGVAIGSDVQAYDPNLDVYAANPLTAAELGELQNIGSTTISSTQWGYVGGLDQALATTDSPTFATVTSTSSVIGGVTVSPSGATLGQALGFPNSTSTLEPYTPAGGGDTLAAVNETISGDWNYTGAPTLSGSPIVSRSATETLTNKTLTSPVLNGTLSGTGIAPYVYAVDTIAGLKALIGGVNEAVEVKGHTSAGDGGGGVFYWDSSATNTDDNGIYIQPSAGGVGRWVRQWDDVVKLEYWGGKADYYRDYFSGNGSDVAFTLDNNIAGSSSFEVTVDGVIKSSPADYSISGTTLTFTSAPASGTLNVLVRGHTTDNAAAINAALSYMSVSFARLQLSGEYYTGNNHTISFENCSITGEGGHSRRSSIICGASSGTAFTVQERSPHFMGWCLGATIARRNQGNPTTSGGITDGHGVFFGKDANLDTISRVRLFDFLVEGHPTDGMVMAASAELADFNQVTVADNCRHGLRIHNGDGQDGFTNETAPWFHALANNVRTKENGGHGLYASNTGSTGYNVVFKNFQALGNLWKRSHDASSNVAQIYTAESGMTFEYPDLEDQQYGNTVSASGFVRQSNATPSAGAYAAGARQSFLNPFLSSLSNGIIVGSVVDVRVISPVSFMGTYATEMTHVVEVSSGASWPTIDISTSQQVGSGGGGVHSDPLQNQSSSASIRVDGDKYFGTSLTATDIRVDRETSDSATISSGSCPEPTATFMRYDSQSGPTDSVSTIKGRASYNGIQIRIVANSGETITYNDGTASTAGAGNNKGLRLREASRTVSASGGEVLVLEFNDITDKWHEVAYLEDNSPNVTVPTVNFTSTLQFNGSTVWDSTGVNLPAGDSFRINGDTVIDASSGIRLLEKNNSEISDISNAVNTTDKARGKLIYNTTDGEVYVAQGSAAGNSWKSLEDGATIVPS